MNKLANRAKEQLQKKTGKKGFTLVEVIVVLVILAILAALLIPSMVKWIDKAHEKEAIVEARTILMSAQTIASETYEKTPGLTELKDGQLTKVTDLANIGGNFKAGATITVANGTVTGFTYETSKGYQVIYNSAADETFAVTKIASNP